MKKLEYPIDVTWSNKDHDVPVTLVGYYGEFMGRHYHKTSTGTGIPDDEIVLPKKKFNFWGLFNRK